MSVDVNSPPTEEELAKIAVAPRVTDADVEAFIAQEYTFTAAEGAIGHTAARPSSPYTVIDPQLELLTICVLVLANGFTVMGQSACADPKNFDPEIGARLARADAKGKVWMLLGFELRSRLALAAAATPKSDPYADTCVGTKVVHAKFMNRQHYCDMRGWTVPESENGEDEGYLVEYADGGAPNVKGYAGYVSWSPKDVFERAYSVVSGSGRPA